MEHWRDQLLRSVLTRGGRRQGIFNRKLYHVVLFLYFRTLLILLLDRIFQVLEKWQISRCCWLLFSVVNFILIRKPITSQKPFVIEVLFFISHFLLIYTFTDLYIFRIYIFSVHVFWSLLLFSKNIVIILKCYEPLGFLVFQIQLFIYISRNYHTEGSMISRRSR